MSRMYDPHAVVFVPSVRSCTPLMSDDKMVRVVLVRSAVSVR